MDVSWISIAALAAALVLAASVMALGSARRAAPFKARAFLTANEAEFLARLESAVPEYRFHCQVAMGALLQPAVARARGGDYHRLRGQFSQKIVDYVAQRRDNGQIIAIIELDDRTHDKARDARRDAMLHAAGYRTVRWQASAKPSRAEILATLVPPPLTAASAGAGTVMPAGQLIQAPGS